MHEGGADLQMELGMMKRRPGEVRSVQGPLAHGPSVWRYLCQNTRGSAAGGGGGGRGGGGLTEDENKTKHDKQFHVHPPLPAFPLPAFKVATKKKFAEFSSPPLPLLLMMMMMMKKP